MPGIPELGGHLRRVRHQDWLLLLLLVPQTVLRSREPL